MTDKTDPIQDDVEATAGGDQQEVSVEDLKSRIASLEAEAAKNRNLAKKAFAERDEAKAKTKTAQEEDYKSLYESEQAEKTKYLARIKSSDVKSALAAQLAKNGVLPDAVAAATKLVDQELIEWDLESGVDGTSVTAAVAKLKRDHAFMFERKVAATDPKAPADGAARDANEMKRSDFDKLDGLAKATAVKKGIKITD